MKVDPIISSSNKTIIDNISQLNDLTEDYQYTNKESKHINTCAQNLFSIGKALKIYEKEYNNFPEWLSDLYPKYLSKSNVLICPADEEHGVPIIPYDTDPNLPVSYNYDCNPDYYQRWLKMERQVHQDANPIVRCSHHANPDSKHTLVSNLHLSLSFSNSIFGSEADWRKHPISMYGNLQAAIDGYEKALEFIPGDPNFFYIYIELIRLYAETEREKDLENLIIKFKSVMNPHGEDIMRFRDYFTLLEMLRVCNKHKDALQLCEYLEKTEPENPWLKSLYRELAVTHEEMGNIELAETYFGKYDSKRKMVGKHAPDFSATDMDGNPISLKDFRGNVVLLDFWATTCGPCIEEMSNIKRIYDTYSDKGFDVIGINVDGDESDVNNFLTECKLPWRQIFNGEEGDLKKLYCIRGIPSLWLIDCAGKVISNNSRGYELRKLVDEAVTEKL